MICSNCGYENNPDDALSCGLCGKVFRKEKREDKEEQDKQPMSKAKKFYAEMKEEWKKEAKDPTGVMRLGRGISKIIKSLRSKEERKEWIFIFCGIVIAIGITLILDAKFNMGIRESLSDLGAKENYMHRYTFFYWYLFIIIGGAIIGGLLLKTFQYISNLFEKRRDRK